MDQEEQKKINRRDYYRRWKAKNPDYHRKYRANNDRYWSYQHRLMWLMDKLHLSNIKKYTMKDGQIYYQVTVPVDQDQCKLFEKVVTMGRPKWDKKKKKQEGE